MNPNCNQKAPQKTDVKLMTVQSEEAKLYSLRKPPAPLHDDQVYILINDASRKVFLWLGSRASVKAKFLGAVAANTIQRQKGMVYRVESVEQQEEPAAFLKSLSVIDI
jgi:hypothetical protein